MKAYVDKGGSLVVLEDPTIFTKIGSNPDPLANYLKTDWEITIENDVVIDLTSNQPFSAILSSYSPSAPITQHMTTVTIMPQSRSLAVAQSLPERDVHSIHSDLAAVLGRHYLASLQS